MMGGHILLSLSPQYRNSKCSHHAFFNNVVHLPCCGEAELHKGKGLVRPSSSLLAARMLREGGQERGRGRGQG